MKFLKIMQENFTFKLIAIFLLSALSFGLCACSEKTPEQIAAENAKKTDIAVRRSKVFLFDEKPRPSKCLNRSIRNAVPARFCAKL